ncbi:MAG: cytochrome b5 domain-containing protein [Azoarcus sp.]|nr:cytochrome b5 domain-containing protein [Azoarcus sp.]
MRKLFIFATLLFWLAVAGFWMLSVLAPDALDTPLPEAATTERQWSTADVARHHTADDCWMIIDGQVYDFSAYVPEHPSNPALFIPWCGKEATEAYLTKTRGRAHSPYADSLLLQYRIGVLR